MSDDDLPMAPCPPELVSLRPPFTPSAFSSTSGADESSLRGVEAREALSRASEAVTLVLFGGKSPPALAGLRDLVGEVGDVASGGGVSDELLSRAGDLVSGLPCE